MSETATIDEVSMDPEDGEASFAQWEQDEALFILCLNPDESIRHHAVSLPDLIDRIAREHTPVFIAALDRLARDKLIEKQLDLVPGQDTGSVSFKIPVTAYTTPLASK